jgi:hypothetical protein
MLKTRRKMPTRKIAKALPTRRPELVRKFLSLKRRASWKFPNLFRLNALQSQRENQRKRREPLQLLPRIKPRNPPKFSQTSKRLQSPFFPMKTGNQQLTKFLSELLSPSLLQSKKFWARSFSLENRSAVWNKLWMIWIPTSGRT